MGSTLQTPTKKAWIGVLCLALALTVSGTVCRTYCWRDAAKYGERMLGPFVSLEHACGELIAKRKESGAKPVSCEPFEVGVSVTGERPAWKQAAILEVRWCNGPGCFAQRHLALRTDGWWTSASGPKMTESYATMHSSGSESFKNDVIEWTATGMIFYRVDSVRTDVGYGGPPATERKKYTMGCAQVGGPPGCSQVKEAAASSP